MISNIILIILNLIIFVNIIKKFFKLNFLIIKKKKNPIKNHLYNNFNKIMESNDN